MKINFDDWYDKFRGSSQKEQYNMLLRVLKEKKIQKPAEIDVVSDCLLKVLGNLDYGNLIEEHLELIELVKQKQETLDKENFMYFNDFLVDYYLFQKQDDLAKEALIMFEQYPVENCDCLISLLTKLQLYQKREIVLKLAKNVFHKILKSDDLVMETDYPFGRVLFREYLQVAYENILKGSKVDWNEFKVDLQKYEFFQCLHTEKEVDFIKECLTNDLPKTVEKKLELQKEKYSRYIYMIGFYFMKHMHTTQKMSFICSSTIWDEFIVFVVEHKPESSVKSKNADLFFCFSAKELKQYVWKLLGRIFSRKQPEAFGLLWGIPYIYDFLLTQEIISESLFKKGMKIISELKLDAQKVVRPNLWVYAFWTDWSSPSYLSMEEFKQEKAIFENSINNKTPLSEEIPEIDDFEDLEDELEEESLVQIEEISRDDIPRIINPNPFIGVGTVINGEKTGRNEPCPCGSGKKYKKCCGGS